jgi:predicted DsbA family dithiol-disulfide isomerase
MEATPAQERRIVVISDAICPWCWIGKRQLERALPELAARGLAFAVAWHPFQLNPDIPAGGADRNEYRASKFGSLARSAEADGRVAEAGTAVGLRFRHDLMRRTPNTVDAHRVIRLAGRHGVQSEVVEALFRGYFTEGADIGDAATLARLAAGAGLDAEAVNAMLASEAERQEVLAEDQSVRRAGLDGVPTFVMGRYVLFSGAVPAEAMVEAFAKAASVIGAQAA